MFEKEVSPLAPESLWHALQGWAETLAKVLVTWQCVAALALGVLIGLLAAGGRPVGLVSVRPRLLVSLSAAVFLACGYGATILVRPVFGDRLADVPRIRNDYLLLLILLFVMYGTLLGRAVRARANRRRQGRQAGMVAVCALAVLGGATVSLVPPLYGLGKEMQVRAAQWDRQSQWLHRQAAAGATTLPYKSLPIQGLLEPVELSPQRDWVGRCAARYYRVDTITRSSVLP
jgi:hypothetical protein